MPRLWHNTIAAHRDAVGDAIVETTAALVNERGLASLTMSEIADRTGIGRATLYKYFPDIAAILIAWHERHIAAHLAHLVQVRDREADPALRLRAVLEAYAALTRHHQPAALDVFLHRAAHARSAERRVSALIAELLAAGVTTGDVRSDVAADELAEYCLKALQAAATARSGAAIHRLVTVTLAGLRPPR